MINNGKVIETGPPTELGGRQVAPAQVHGTTVRYSQLYTTGILASGLASTSFFNLAVAIAGERENGGLKRLAGTPNASYGIFRR